MTDVRTVDSSATAYNASLGANPPAQVGPVPGELFSFSPLWIVAIAAAVLVFWLGRRSKRATPATATAPAATASAPAAAPAAAPAPTRSGNWFTRWFTPSAAVMETITSRESEDLVDLMQAITPSANLDRTSLKKSLPKFVAKLKELQNNGNFELRRYELRAPDSLDLEHLLTRFIDKNSSHEATNQTLAQERNAFENESKVLARRVGIVEALFDNTGKNAVTVSTVNTQLTTNTAGNQKGMVTAHKVARKALKGELLAEATAAAATTP